MNELLSSGVSPVLGLLALLLLFGVCFCAVHAVKLAKIGWKHRENEPKKSDQTTEKTSTPERKSEAQEHVYYIVERKKRRAKSEYSEPKEFRFKSS